ncbi:MAG: DUF1638 domain-containing protein [Phycisphaerae bacterium]|jgi:hypothetical protein
MSDNQTRKFKFIGCEIVYREACYLAATGPHHVDVQFLRKGLHDLERADMNAKIQSAIDAVETDCGYEAILLGYGRCNDGLVGVTARDLPLVLPRAHDCIAFFFGSRRAYMRYFEEHPGTYYMTTGWAERNNFEQGQYSHPAYGKEGVMGKLGLAESYEEMVAKYGKDNADFIRETMGDWKRNYSRMLYLEMGACDEAAMIESSRAAARERQWEFEVRKGDWSLLRRLFYGQWDEDFLVLPPGAKVVARNDDAVVDAQ